MNKQKGAFGEQIASKYLEKIGHKIIETNWTCRWGELDIISTYNTSLIFTEVKYRTSFAFGYPSEALTYKKKSSLHRSINIYLIENSHSTSWEFWVICLVGVKNNLRLSLYKDCF